MTDDGDRLGERKLPAPSDIIAGKYEVEQVVASGGMGVVVVARHLHLDQRVAVKFLLPHMAERKEIVSRFLREARAAVSLRGEHAVRVYDVGVLENGAPYMVMEYLRGHDLDEELRRAGRRPIAEAAAWVLEACEAIAEAHALGIVHRDIKPANLFLARQPDGSRVVKVLDFGISKVSESTRENQKLTSTATVLGSPQYMSPEQVRNASNVDGRSDIWALGVVLYELVTDMPPFPAETIPALSAMIVSDPPAPMRDDQVPPEFQAIILKCLEKDPSKRYADVVELAAALAPFAPEVLRAVERIAGIARGTGKSERPPGSSDRDGATATRRRGGTASPDAETVSAAGAGVAVSANSAPSDGSTFTATLQSAKPLPVSRVAVFVVAGLIGFAAVATMIIRSGGSDERRETSPASAVSAPVAPGPETAPVDRTDPEPSAMPAVPVVPVNDVKAVEKLARPKSPHSGPVTAKDVRPKSPKEPEHGVPVSIATPPPRGLDPLGDRK